MMGRAAVPASAAARAQRYQQTCNRPSSPPVTDNPRSPDEPPAAPPAYAYLLDAQALVLPIQCCSLRFC